MEADCIESNAYDLLGLDRNGLMCLSFLMLASYSATIETMLELFVDPSYDPEEGFTWLDKWGRQIIGYAIMIISGMPDELLDEDTVNGLMNTIRTHGSGAVDRLPIYIDNGNALLVDGHHRLEAFRRLGYKRVPIKYVHHNQLARAPFFRSLQELRLLMHK